MTRHEGRVTVSSSQFVVALLDLIKYLPKGVRSKLSACGQED